MKFSYRLSNGAGWAEIQFAHADFSRAYGVESCMGDILVDLFVGLIVLSGNKSKTKFVNDIIDQHTQNMDGNVFEWTASVGTVSAKFIFKLVTVVPFDGEAVNLRIIERGFNGKDEDCVFDQNLNLDNLIDSLLGSCRELLLKYGIIGYYENFWVEFPVSHYLALMDHREGKITCGSFIEKIEGKDEEFRKTSIEEEKSYLH